MDNYWWVRIILDWIPFVVFVGLMIYFIRKGVGGRQTQFMEATKQYQIDHLAETRKISASLERISAALEKAESSK